MPPYTIRVSSIDPDVTHKIYFPLGSGAHSRLKDVIINISDTFGEGTQKSKDLMNERRKLMGWSTL